MTVVVETRDPPSPQPPGCAKNRRTACTSSLCPAGQVCSGVRQPGLLRAVPEGRERSRAALPKRGRLGSRLPRSSQQKFADVTSNANGRGKFRLRVKKNPIYHFKVTSWSRQEQFDILPQANLSRRFESKVSPVRLELDRRVVDWRYRTQARRAARQVPTGAHGQNASVPRNRAGVPRPQRADRLLGLVKLGLPNERVVAVHVYKSSNARQVSQESLLFVQPPGKVQLQMGSDRPKPLLGDAVKMRVKVGGKLTRSAIARAVACCWMDPQ